MPTDPFKIATAVLTVGLAYDVVLSFRARKVAKQIIQSNDELHEFNAQLINAAHTLHKQVEFLSAKLEAAGVEIDEFDRIIFHSGL